MIGLLCFVLAVLVAPVKSKMRLEAENAVLRHQLTVLRRRLWGRVRLTYNDRWFPVVLCRSVDPSCSYFHPSRDAHPLAPSQCSRTLPSIVGKHNAMYMLLTGRFVTAEDTLRMGLISDIVPGNYDVRALEIAEEIAALPPLTVMQTKDAVLSGVDIPLSSSLQIERKAHELMYGAQDMRESALFDHLP